MAYYEKFWLNMKNYNVHQAKFFVFHIKPTLFIIWYYSKCWNILESEKVRIWRIDIYSYFLTKRSIFEEWTIRLFHILIRKDLDETNFFSKIQVYSARKIFQVLKEVNFSPKFLIFYVSPCPLKTATNWV